MAVFQNLRIFVRSTHLFKLLSPTLQSSLSSSDRDDLVKYEDYLRVMMLKDQGGRLAFFIMLGLMNDEFKQMTLDSLKESSEEDLRVFGASWKRFLRIVMLQAATPPQCRPFEIRKLNEVLGAKVHVTAWMMVKRGWLKPSGWKYHFTLSDKGVKLAETVIKHAERRYSAFFIDQLELKRERMGDIF